MVDRLTFEESFQQGNKTIRHTPQKKNNSSHIRHEAGCSRTFHTMPSSEPVDDTTPTVPTESRYTDSEEPSQAKKSQRLTVVRRWILQQWQTPLTGRSMPTKRQH